jgi:hypothetical protein
VVQRHGAQGPGPGGGLQQGGRTRRGVPGWPSWPWARARGRGWAGCSCVGACGRLAGRRGDEGGAQQQGQQRARPDHAADGRQRRDAPAR